MRVPRRTRSESLSAAPTNLRMLTARCRRVMSGDGHVQPAAVGQADVHERFPRCTQRPELRSMRSTRSWICRRGRPAPPRAGFGGSCGPRRRSSARPSPPSSPNDHAPARRLPIDRSASAPGPRPGILDEAVGRAERLTGRGPFQLTVQQPRRKAAGLVDDLAQPALRPGPGPAGEDLQPFPYRGHLRLGGSHSARSISSAVTAMLSGTSCVGDQKSGRRARATRCPRRCNATPPLSAAFFPAQMPVATSR